MAISDHAAPQPPHLNDAHWGGATRAWVEQHLPASAPHITEVTRLRGGWTSEMRRIVTTGPDERRSLVLRSFTKPFFVTHSHGLLTREAGVLRLLEGTDIPAATLIAVDASAQHCEHPSLLMSLLPGTIRLDDEDAERRSELLARQLLAIHHLPVPAEARPRPYQPWTSPERVTPPADTTRPELWQRAIDVIRRDPPPHTACFLHRDYHPGNVLFSGANTTGDLRITGVVDWVETSWGPADLDVAHCSTALALLHGVPTAMSFAERYRTAAGAGAAPGGALAAADSAAHLYWCLLDALAFAPDAEKVAVPWRSVGRTDLTPALLTARLEQYLLALFDRREGHPGFGR